MMNQLSLTKATLGTFNTPPSLKTLHEKKSKRQENNQINHNVWTLIYPKSTWNQPQPILMYNVRGCTTIIEIFVPTHNRDPPPIKNNLQV